MKAKEQGTPLTELIVTAIDDTDKEFKRTLEIDFNEIKPKIEKAVIEHIGWNLSYSR